MMPWQQLVADVGGELDPDTGLPAYREVVFTVPRQSGKTTLLLAWQVQRALGWGSPQRIVYSAQSGADARKKLLEDQVPILEPRKRLLGIKSILRANGNEAVVWENASRLVLLASTADSGHGKTVDLAVKDELFADYDDRRDQTLVPAMATRAAAQMVTASTMGTDDSVPWNRTVERGRMAVESGRRSGIAYFEWSAHPDDDPTDHDLWWTYMPALGHTITEEVVDHARLTLPAGEFRRAFQNLSMKSEERVIPSVAWSEVCDPTAAPSGPLVFALDTNPERSSSSIAAAGGGAAELIAHADGTGWVVEWAREKPSRREPVWIIDEKGPAGSLIPDLEGEGVTVKAIGARELVEACGHFYDGVLERRFKVRSHTKLDEAAAGAAKRAVGDAWAWTRKNAAVNVSPLVAATLAVWGARQPDRSSVYEGKEMLIL